MTAENLATACVLCSHDCGLRVDVRDGVVVAVRSDEENPATRGYRCNKAAAVPHYIQHEQRVQTPLAQRADGTFEPTTWDHALSDIAGRLATMRREHGPDSIAFVGGGGQANHADVPYALGLLSALGSARWFGAFAQEKTQHGLVDLWMFDGTVACFLHPDTERTKYLLVLGTNPRVSHRGHRANEVLREIHSDSARRIVVIDPRETETARGADEYVRIQPGGDPFLLMGMIAHILAEGLVDHEYLARHARHFEEVRLAFAKVDVAEMASRSGVPTDVMCRLARELSTTKPAAILHDLGLEQVPFSTFLSYLVRLLSALTGNLGREGGNIFLPTPAPPDPRWIERRAPSRAAVSGIPGIRALSPFDQFSPNLFPEEVLTPGPRQIRAVIVEGANPLLSFADTPKWREAFAALELIVVIDPAFTETARLAHYVLPAPVGYEKWEFAGFPNTFPTVHFQLRPPVVPAPPDALPEPEIFTRLARLSGAVPPPPRALAVLAGRVSTRVGRRALVAGILAATTALSLRDPMAAMARVVFWSYELLGPAFESPMHSVVYLLCLKNALARREPVIRVLGEGYRYRSPFGLADELFDRILAHPEGTALATFEFASHLEDNIGFADKRIRLAPTPMLAELERALARTIHDRCDEASLGGGGGGPG